MIACNGEPVLELRLALPTVGAWVAALEVSIEDAAAPTGAVVISDDVATYRGTVVRSGVTSEAARLEVVGGAGGLARELPAASYHRASARDVLIAMLLPVGEKLDPSSTPAVLATPLPFWTRVQGRVGASIATLATALGAVWRVRPDGSIWIGTETWPAFKGDPPLELDRDHGASTVVLAPDTMDLVPGTTLAGERVGRVEHRVDRTNPLRTTFWLAA